MDENKALSYWMNDRYKLKFQIDTGKKDSEKLYAFFETAFRLRDEKWGSPNYDRIKNNIFTTTFWELAETFFAHFKSKEFVEKLKQYCIDPECPRENIVHRHIAVLDDFFRYGFIATSKKANGDRHRFWQIYFEDFSSKELKKIIPVKYVSRTGHNQSQQQLEGTTPLLIGSRREEAINHLSGKIPRRNASQKRVDEITLDLMNRTKDEFDNLDWLQVRFYRKWNHPVIIFDHQDSDQYFFPTINSLDAFLDHLALIYPRLNGQDYDSTGNLKDFDEHFLVSS